MEDELNKWLKYLGKIESLVNSEIPLTEYQKEEREYIKKKIEELEKEIKETNEKSRKCSE